MKRQEPEDRIKPITIEVFKKLLATKAIRPASLNDVEGTHHKRPLFRHPNTGAFFTTTKET